MFRKVEYLACSKNERSFRNGCCKAPHSEHNVVCGLLQNRSGAVHALEFLFVSIPVILCMIAIVQFIFIAQTMVALEYAAYSAARSALVHSCRPVPLLAPGQSVFGVLKGVWGTDDCDEPSSATGRWATAARIAIIPVSPSSTKSAARQGECGYPAASVDFLAVGPVGEPLRDALHHKACYAFEANNVQVSLKWELGKGGMALVKTLPPITATVQYRAPVFVPVRGLFATDRREDGTYYRLLTAEATVL